MDIELLVDKITKEVIKTLKNGKKKISIISNKKENSLSELLGNDYVVSTENDAMESDYVLLSKEKYYELLQNSNKDCKTQIATENKVCNKTLSLVGKKVIQERDLKNINIEKFDAILISKKAIITALAKDVIKSNSILVKYDS